MALEDLQSQYGPTNKRGQKDESSFSHRDQKKKRKSRKKYY